MSLVARSAGVYSLVVDGGRRGVRHLGIPAGGAADRAAWHVANALVGNRPDAVALELTLAGPTLVATADTACAVFGAPFELTIDGRPVPAGASFTVAEGRTLRIGGTPAGVRGCLAVGGGLAVPAVLGGRTGFAPVAAGDVLTCGPSRTPGRRLPAATVPGLLGDPPGDAVLRTLPGPQADWFPAAALGGGVYTVSAAADRMGVRLAGPAVAKRPGELASEPAAPGTVQVTHAGLPVVLGVDGQTVGGYPAAAVVVRADLDRLARLRPGTAVRFVTVSAAEAQAAAADYARRARGWVGRLGCQARTRSDGPGPP